MKRLWVVLAIFALAGCTDKEEATAGVHASVGEALMARLDESVVAQTNGLTVQLAFEADVDLDLYVTGPLSETVYFANHQSKSGGVISDDVRCDTQHQRVEEVVYAKPMPGRYRVGVDFPSRCNDGVGVAPFAVLVQYPGGIYRDTGVVNLQHFEVAVMEFELQ